MRSIGNVHHAFKYCDCWPGQHHRCLQALLGHIPTDGQQPAVGVDIDLRIKQPQPNARHHRRTSARAAGQRLACAALIDAPFDFAAT